MPLPRLPATERLPKAELTPRRRPPTRTRRRALQAGTLVVAIVIGLIAAAAIRGASGPGPEDLVRDFFAVLTARDSAGLRGTAGCSSNPLCEVGTLRTGYQPPQNLHIDSKRPVPPTSRASGAKQVEVQMSYDIAGQRKHDVVNVLYARTGMFSGYWSILDPPGAALTMPAHAIANTKLAGLDTTTITRDKPVTFWAPPGQYTATRPGTALFEPAETTVVIAADPATVTLPAALKPGVAGEVEQQIHDRIDACATQHTFEPDTDVSSSSLHNCPMKHSNKYAITDKPTWTVQRYPTIKLDAHPDGTITVATTNAGKATIHYQWTMYLVEPRTWTPVDATYDLNIEGFVKDVDDKPIWIAP